MQYAAAASVPLIKSHALRVPPPVALPPDIHPLPPSVTPYFVYPFTLEPHVVRFVSSLKSTLATNEAEWAACIRAREDEKDRRTREALRRVAPGFEGGTVLMPVRVSSDLGRSDASDALDGLVDHLARLDA